MQQENVIYTRFNQNPTPTPSKTGPINTVLPRTGTAEQGPCTERPHAPTYTERPHTLSGIRVGSSARRHPSAALGVEHT